MILFNKEFNLNDLLLLFVVSANILRIIKSRKVRWAGNVALRGEKRCAYKAFVENPEGKRPIGRLRCRSDDNIKIDLREIG
jgi:hypothetical protein